MKNKIIKPILVTLVIFAMVLPTASAVDMKIDKNDIVQVTDEESFEYDFGGQLTKSRWNLQTQTTRDDDPNDKDTGECLNWPPSYYNGVYGDIENGQWRVCAAECGPVNPFADPEKTEGYSIIKSPKFKLSDFSGIGDDTVNMDGFQITSATLYLDYKFGSNDFSNSANDDWVEVRSIELRNVDEDREYDIQKETLKWYPKDLGYPAGGEWKYKQDSNYAASNSNLRNKLNENHEDEYQIIIQVNCKLVAGIGNCELFKFWLEDVRIEGEYSYNSDPVLDVPDTFSFSGNHIGDITDSFEVANAGGGSLNWEITDVRYIGSGFRYPYISVSPESGSGVTFGNPDSVTVTVSLKQWSDYDQEFKWNIYIQGGGETQIVVVKFTDRIKARPIFSLLQERFPFLFELFASKALF